MPPSLARWSTRLTLRWTDDPPCPSVCPPAVDRIVAVLNAPFPAAHSAGSQFITTTTATTTASVSAGGGGGSGAPSSARSATWSFPADPSADPALHLHSLLSSSPAGQPPAGTGPGAGAGGGGGGGGPTTAVHSPPAYTSFDAADLWALAPWLKEGAAGEGRGVKGSRVWGGVGFLREEGRESF